MARCWSCGAEIRGGLHPRYWFTCPNCAQVEELQSLRREASSNLAELARIQEHGFQTLSDRLSEVATIIEWGFEEVKWELQQQTDVLRSIDHTLRTPSETRANEWRRMAEELRKRGVLGQSEEFFLKALKVNPLDYRIYIGLAESYLRLEKFDRAKALLEKSLPHAPVETEEEIAEEEEMNGELLEEIHGEPKVVFVCRECGNTSPVWKGRCPICEKWNTFVEKREAPELPQKFDYKSYSYRLIGRVYFCEENYHQAASVLQKSVELSPGYWEGHYDYAQYCALAGKKQDSLTSLQKAIVGNPFYFYLAAKEKNFTPLRGQVDNLLREQNNQILREAKEGISLARRELRKAEEAVFAAREALHGYEKYHPVDEYSDLYALKSEDPCEEARQEFSMAERQATSGNYLDLLQAKVAALRAKEQAIEARGKADEKREVCEERYSDARKKQREERKSALFWGLICVGMIGMIVGGVALSRLFGVMSDVLGIFMIIGGIIGLLVVIGAHWH